MKNKFLIIIPTYNEAPNIPILISKLQEVQNKLNFDLLFVDDNSQDGTRNLIKSTKYAWINLLERSKKNGLGEAYKAGFKWAETKEYEFVIEMDADGSHRVEDLPVILKADQKFDLVVGSRLIPGGKVVNWPWYRRYISRLGNYYARKLLNLSIRDSTSGFRRLRLNSLHEINAEKIMSKGYGFQVEMVNRFELAGKTTTEVPIIFVERIHGDSKMTVKIAAEAFWRLLQIRFYENDSRE